MKQQDAKQQIIRLWNIRDRNKRTMMDIVGFYGQLEREHSELLQFKYIGHDKYHKIKEWLTPYTLE